MVFLGSLVTGCVANPLAESDPDTSILADLVAAQRGTTPTQAASDAFNTQSPDTRRRAIAFLAAQPYGGERPYLAVYRTIITDPDPTVQAAAAAALGRHGEPADAFLITPLLNSEETFLRWEAAKALRLIHQPGVVPSLILALRTDKEPDPRAALAEALGQYPRSDVFDALNAALADTDFGVAAAAHRSLTLITGKDAGLDPRDWSALANSTGRESLFQHAQPYTIPEYQGTPGWIKRRITPWAEHNPVTTRTPTGLDNES